MTIFRKTLARTRIALRRLRGKPPKPEQVYEATFGRTCQPDESGDEALVRYDPHELETYATIQRSKSAKQAHQPWFTESHLTLIAQEIVAHVATPEFGICHGAKSGGECALLARLTGANVIGTDISDHVRGLPHMIVWDFHEENPEWIGRADFIYSNSWDHCHDPSRAFRAWARSLRDGGLLIFEHSWQHNPDRRTAADSYGATPAALVARVESAANGRVRFGCELRLPNGSAIFFSKK